MTNCCRSLVDERERNDDDDDNGDDGWDEE